MIPQNLAKGGKVTQGSQFNKSSNSRNMEFGLVVKHSLVRAKVPGYARFKTRLHQKQKKTRQSEKGLFCTF